MYQTYRQLFISPFLPVSMEFDALVAKRRSVRSFKKKPANWRDIVEAVDSARNIPLAGNDPTIRFLVVQDKEKIEKLARFSEQLWITEASIVIAVCSDDSMLEKQYGERGRIYSRQQAGAAIQTLLFKLVDLGLSACWVGSYDDNKIRCLLEIPAKIQIEALIPIGYERIAPSKKYKRSLKGITFWEKWDTQEIPPIFKEPTFTE